MTTGELINGFLLEWDLNGSAAVAGFEDDEIVDLLNKAQLDIVKKIYLEYGPKQIYKVNKTAGTELTAVGGINNYEYSANLFADYMYDIDVSVSVKSRSDFPEVVMSSWIPAHKIEPKDASKFVHTGMNFLLLPHPVYYINDNKIIVLTDTLTTLNLEVTNLELTYVKIPTSMDESHLGDENELSAKWHQDIIDRAVFYAMKITNDFRIRQLNINKTVEK